MSWYTGTSLKPQNSPLVLVGMTVASVLQEKENEAQTTVLVRGLSDSGDHAPDL